MQDSPGESLNDLQSRIRPHGLGFYEAAVQSEMANASAAWGIIFNTPSFLQLVEKAFGIRRFPKILWSIQVDGKRMYADPFREDILFPSVEAFEQSYERHIEAARQAFTEMDVFIITLGLNEVWFFRADGSAFSRSPWRTAPSLVEHRTLTVEENVATLTRMTDIIWTYNSKVSIICTLSPVPLHATFVKDTHVVVANTHSKAVLRVAAQEFQARRANMYYFPSYEVVTQATEHPWMPDQRHVTRETIERVMNLFHKMYNKDAATE